MVLVAAVMAAGASAREPVAALSIEALPPLPAIDWEPPSQVPPLTVGEGTRALPDDDQPFRAR